MEWGKAKWKENWDHHPLCDDIKKDMYSWVKLLKVKDAEANIVHSSTQIK